MVSSIPSYRVSADSASLFQLDGRPDLKGVDQYLRLIVQSHHLRLNGIDDGEPLGAGASNALTSH